MDLRLLCASVLLAASTLAQPGDRPAATPHGAVTPTDRKDAWWTDRHKAVLDRVARGHREGDVGMVFIGDSITQGWEGEGRAVWDEFYAKRGAINLGFSGDRTQHVLWRLEHGELDGLRDPLRGRPPRLVVIMIGTNNSNGADHTAEEIADGVTAVVGRVREKLPEAKVLLLAIFPRGERPGAQREKNERASAIASALADGRAVIFRDIGPQFLEEGGALSPDVMPDALHLSERGYRIWAEAIEPTVREVLGDR